MNLLGLSVTIPHKVTILPYLDEIDETAKRIGSVNTVLHRDRRLTGYNSDGMGAFRALKEAGVILANQKVTILGSGGAARAIAFTLGKEAALKEMVLLGIDAEECAGLCEDLCKAFAFPISWKPLASQSLERHLTDSAGLIHCTPVGMSPRADESLVDYRLLRPEHFVFDIVYNPLRTKLLQEAESVGCRIIPGMEMFIHQAVFQFELWTGEKAPVDCMRRVVREALA
jgi:shikimate dehydrogenase